MRKDVVFMLSVVPANFHSSNKNLVVVAGVVVSLQFKSVEALERYRCDVSFKSFLYGTSVGVGKSWVSTS